MTTNPISKPPPTDPGRSAILGLPPVQPAVSIHGLNHWYGAGANKAQALADIDLEIDRGEVVILTGPSGSGKTTLLTVIGALRRVEQGNVRVLGRDVRRLDNAGQVALRRDVGFIFQFHNLFDSLTAIENVRMATALKPGSVAEMNRRSEAILTRLGMADRMDHLPSELSGGQNQRVAIARALVNQPAMVLADEPTASLDAESGQEVLTVLHELASGSSRTTVLIVTHDQRVLDRADRIVNLVSGRIVSNVRTDRAVRIVGMLQKLPRCEGMSPSTLTRIAERMTAESRAPGDVIVREGEFGDRLYLINQGVADATSQGQPPGKLTSGDAFGQITEFTETRVRETVTARTPLELFVLTHDAFQQVLQTDKDLAQRVKLHLMTRQ
ncbi:MAG TPA: ATP-binding cassette domain-containing protein [Isosphaeraceae bacterium]|nr:ATP-binding cassette domain-containing protein [Isosphaeraceae bacterium]